MLRKIYGKLTIGRTLTYVDCHFGGSSLSGSWNPLSWKAVRSSIGRAVGVTIGIETWECVRESLGVLRVQNFTAFGIRVEANTDRRQLEPRVLVSQAVVRVPRLHTHILLTRLESLWVLPSLLDTSLPSGNLSSDLILPVTRDYIACLPATLFLASTLVLLGLLVALSLSCAHRA